MSCSMSINYEAIESLAKAYEKAPDLVLKEAKKAVRSVAIGLIGNVKANTRVKTGTLRRGYIMSGVAQHGSEVSATVTNSVEYAPYIEYGHRIVDKNHMTIGFWKGDHMLEKATEIARGELKRKSEAIIKKVKESIKV